MHISVTLGCLAFATANANSILYMGSAETVPYDTALSRCASFGGQLATFGSADEFAALLEVRNDLGSTMWLGFNDRGTEHHWEFVDGDTSFCQATGTGLDCDDIPQWNPGEPNNYGGEDCAELESHGINDQSCEDSNGFLCEFNGGAHDYAVTEQGGAIYVARNNDRVNYATAKQRCAGIGGQLATFGDDAQFQAMLSVRNRINADSWIGLDDIHTEQHWQFVDGDLSFCQPYGPGLDDCDDIPQWNPGEPDNLHGGQDCAQIDSNNIGDRICSDLKAYVCEFDARSFAYTNTVASLAFDPSFLLGECEGDCDDDNDCAGDLKCLHNSVPAGCSGTAYHYTYDYCYNPSIAAAEGLITKIEDAESLGVAAEGAYAYDAKDMAIAALVSTNLLLVGGCCVAALTMFCAKREMLTVFFGKGQQVSYGKVDEPEF